jgi:hypothetical protein
MAPLRFLTPTLFLLSITQAASSSSLGVCDIFAAGGTPCVAAFSITRALYGSYIGPLYVVLNSASNATKDIGVISAGGTADAASQDLFCGSSLCIVQRIYDQSPSGNHLGIEKGPSWFPPPRNSQDAGVNLTAASRVSLGGLPVYSAVFDTHCETSGPKSCDGLFAGYSNRTARDTPVGEKPQTVYAIYNGKHYNTGCCYEFGNAEKNSTMLGGSMEAVYYGCNDTHPPLPPCDLGPYVYSDLEHMHEMMTLPGFEPVHIPQPVDFIFAIVKGKQGRLSVASADAQHDTVLRILYDGPYPANYTSKKQGGIVLGVGGDNSPYGSGTFYEGAIVSGFSSSQVDTAVLANIVAAGYGR